MDSVVKNQPQGLQVCPRDGDAQEFRCIAGPAPWTGAYAFTGQEFDFPPAGRPKLLYMVAATRRSGSTFFCRHLWQTGMLGAPMEYFSLPHVMLELAPRLGASSPYDYVNAVLARRTSANGVFGMKVMLDHLAIMRVMSVRFRTPHVIFVQRRDSVAQAVSLAKALQTRQWNSLYPTSPQSASYNFNHILNCLKRIRQEVNAWEGWFRENRIVPIPVYYEDFTRDPEGVVGEILTRFGIALDPVHRIPLPSVERQADSTSSQWITRFREEAAERSIGL